MRKRTVWFFLVLIIFTCCACACAEQLVLPHSVTEIAEEAFAGDTSLEEAVLPENLRFIGPRAFAGSSLKTVNLPASLEYIAEDAFEGTSDVIFITEKDTYAWQWIADRQYGFPVSVEAVWTDAYALAWPVVEGAEDYRVFVYADENCGELVSEEPADDPWGSLVYTDVGTQYWFAVEYTKEGQVFRGSPVTAEPIAPMTAPGNLQAGIRGNGQVTLTWDPVEGATGYRIYWSTDSDIWNPDMEWYGFEGGPGNSELSIGEDQTLYVWVCADNGRGPNLRTFLSVYRGFAPHFSAEEMYDAYVELGVFAEDAESCLYSDTLVYSYVLGDYENWAETLQGDPVWTAVLLEGEDTGYYFECPVPGSADLHVGMPSEPGLIQYEVRCSWDTAEVSGILTLRYLIPDILPTGVDLPEEMELYLHENNEICCMLAPEDFSLGYADRVELRDFEAGNSWSEGRMLHICPEQSGDFYGCVEVHYGNLVMSRTVLFHVRSRYEMSGAAAQAVYTDTYDLSWEPVPGVDSYLVSIYADGDCTEFIRTVPAEELWGTSVLTDVGTQYWFVVEYLGGDKVFRTAPVTDAPLETMPAPENLLAAVDEEGRIHLSWDRVEGATGYRVAYSRTDSQWSTDAEWYGLGNNPEDSSLVLEEGQTVYIWVCADNGNGPNLRTGITVERKEEIDVQAKLDCLTPDENIDDMEAYYLLPMIEYLPTEGITDPEELNRIADWNAQAEEANAAVEQLNGAWRNLIGLLDQLDDDSEFSEDEQSVHIAFGDYSFDISEEAFALLNAEFEVLDYQILENGSTVTKISAGGWCYDLRITDSEITVSESGSASGAVVRSRNAQGIANVRGLFDTLNQISSGSRDVAMFYDVFDGYLDTLLEDEAARMEYGLPAERFGLLLKGIGLKSTCDTIADDYSKLRELYEISSHSHPSDEEMHFDYTREISDVLNTKLGLAIFCFSQDLIINGIDVGCIAKSLAKDFSIRMGKRALDSKLVKFLDLPLGLIAKNYRRMGNELYHDCKRIDRELHYEVIGTVKDEKNQQLADVKVSCLDYTKTVSEIGYYSMEVPNDMSYLIFSKDGYYDKPVQVSCKPYDQTVKNVVLKKKTWGTVEGNVKDEFGDNVYGVTVSCGEYQTRTDAYGNYTLSLPTGSRQLLYIKNGYVDGHADVNVGENRKTEKDMVLPWKYGIHGTVDDQYGPVSYAFVQIRKSGYSRPSYSVSADENGEFRYMVPPGDYSVEITAGYHIADDFKTNKVTWDFAIQENGGVKEITAHMINTRGLYAEKVSFSLGYPNTRTYYYCTGVFSWEGHTVHYSGDPTASAYTPYIVSSSRYVDVSCDVEYYAIYDRPNTENEVRRRKTGVLTVDLSSRKEGWTVIEKSLASLPD